MNFYIQSMFDGFSGKIDADTNYLKDRFIILVRKTNYSPANEKYERLLCFYNVLNETGDLKTARIESGFNFKEAKHYINFLNMVFEKHVGKPFYSKKLDIRKRRRV